MDYNYGEIIAFAGSYVPKGFLPCDGRILKIRENEVLYYLFGNTYGGDGETTFALPNLQGIVPVCKDESKQDYALGKYGNDESEDGIIFEESNLNSSANQKSATNNSNGISRVAINYLICTSGVFPDYDR